jgi:hypothetical protein
MRNQSSVFAALFLSAIAGMVASEAVSYHYDHSPASESRFQSQQPRPEPAELALRHEKVY